MSQLEEAWICDGVRTPFGRYGGGLAGVRPDDLAAIVVRALVARHGSLDSAAIDDVLLGCANQAGEDNRNVGRMASLLAGLPASVGGTTLNRLCGSGLDAVAMAARSLKTGEAEMLLAGGVESMSRAPFVLGKAETAYGRGQRLEDTTLGWRFVNPAMEAAYGTDSMPETAENVASEYGISRDDQDAFALRSQQRAAAAQAAGVFAEEIVPVEIDGKKGKTVVQVDEQPRPETTLEALSRLKPVVRPDGSVTAGNASTLNDGAAALLLASQEAIGRFGLKPLGRVLASTVAGVLPRVMGIGPVAAVRKVLALTGLSLEQVDVIELNEAFAAQALAVLRELGLADDSPRVNPNGGAIALGHPLGASGARLVLSTLLQLRRTGGRYGLCTMCIGVGQGIAMVVERMEGARG